MSWAQLLIFISSCTALRLFDENRDADEPFSGDQLLEGFAALGVSGAESDPFGVSEERHASSVAKAFRFYARARRAPLLVGQENPVDAAALAKAQAVQAQFVLGANVLLTEIEQDIADPAVSVVLDLVPRRIGEAMDWRLAKLAQRFRGIPTHYSSLVLPFLHANERRAVDAVWSRFMTDQVLVMALPTESLRVGRDIPPRRRDAPVLPCRPALPQESPGPGTPLLAVPAPRQGRDDGQGRPAARSWPPTRRLAARTVSRGSGITSMSPNGCAASTDGR